MRSEMLRRTLRLAEKVGVLRPRELDAHGIPRDYLARLHQRGLVTRVGRGLYVLLEAPPTEHRTLAEVCKRVPHGVVCLLSALRFHELTTQMPSQVWLAIAPNARRPREPQLPMRIVYFSGRALTEGVETHEVEGVTVRVYGIAKTVADCFKYRNKIGIDVAVEALRDCVQEQRCSLEALWTNANICRVASVMRPYMEAIV